MKIVLDTNCFISCIGKNSFHRMVFDAFLDGRYTLCVSTEILLEYEEKFIEFWGQEVANNLLGALLTAENVQFCDVYFNFQLVQNDPDDNKFADTYLYSNADMIVSNDRRLLALNDVEFPPVLVITLDEFLEQIGRI